LGLSQILKKMSVNSSRFYFFAVDVDVDAAGAGFCHKWEDLWQR